MMTKLLVTGSTGQLGREFCKLQSSEYEIAGISSADADITSPEQVRAVLSKHKPDLIVHTAAMTDVDACEKNPERAHQVNTGGPENIAKAALDYKALIIYISTDYVFDGEKNAAYTESDIPNPISIYGRTKLEGEKAVQNNCSDWIIIRTSWIYSSFGNNFIKSVIKQAYSEKPLKVVNDQIGSPTWTKDIVKQTMKLIDSGKTQLFHVASKGKVSRFDMATYILRALKFDREVIPISTREMSRPAKRPKCTPLVSERLGQLGIDSMRPYTEALDEFLELHGEELLHEIAN
jgi:dTDP-4-dehydrorhamnose reductase